MADDLRGIEEKGFTGLAAGTLKPVFRGWLTEIAPAVNPHLWYLARYKPGVSVFEDDEEIISGLNFKELEEAYLDISEQEYRAAFNMRRDVLTKEYSVGTKKPTTLRAFLEKMGIDLFAEKKGPEPDGPNLFVY